MKYFVCLFFLFYNAICFAEISDTLTLFSSGYVYNVDSAELIKAKVPGSIYTDLILNNKIADPFIGNNEKNAKWVERCQWDYIDTFLLSEKQLLSKHIELNLEGVDTYAKIYLNDQMIGSCNNMFVRYSFDIKEFCKAKNVLKIKILPINKVIDSLANTIPYKLPGGNRVYARKAALNFGWDFAPDLRAGGLWKNVKVICTNFPKVNNVRFFQNELSSTLAKGSFELNINSDEISTVNVELFSEKGFIANSKTFELHQGLNNFKMDFEVHNPELWATNGNGKVALYDFDLVIKSGDKIIYDQTKSIGFRIIKLVQEKDKLGESFYFLLNGKKVFCKGANVVPPEYFAGVATDSEWVGLVERAADMNMNMLRVWGGGVYPPQSFYDACDKYGIMVWQDFMFACAMYPGDSLFVQSVQSEAKQAILNYRNHPSLALWCGNNENIEGWYNWGWQKEFNYSTQDSMRIISDYKNLFEKILQGEVKEYDSQTSYWPSSPSIGWGRSESMTKGDAHYWGVWWGLEPFEKYKEKIPRFMSEYGFQSFPTYSSVVKFTNSGNIRMNSLELVNHQKHPTGFETIDKYMTQYYYSPKDFNSRTYLSNILQAKGVSMAIRAHRSAMPNCMGSLVWQLNDCWPGISWSLFDYYGKEKAAYYEVRKSFQNVIVASELKDRKLTVKLISDSTITFPADLVISLIDFNGNVRWSDKLDVYVKSKMSSLVYEKDLKIVSRLISDSTTFISISLLNEDHQIAADFQYFTIEKNLVLKRPSVSMKRTELPDNVSRFEISVNYFTKNVELSIKNDTGGFSDNYFDMVPNKKYIIDHKSNSPVLPNDGLNIRSLVDSY